MGREVCLRHAGDAHPGRSAGHTYPSHQPTSSASSGTTAPITASAKSSAAARRHRPRVPPRRHPQHPLGKLSLGPSPPPARPPRPSRPPPAPFSCPRRPHAGLGGCVPLGPPYGRPAPHPRPPSPVELLTNHGGHVPGPVLHQPARGAVAPSAKESTRRPTWRRWASRPPSRARCRALVPARKTAGFTRRPSPPVPAPASTRGCATRGASSGQPG